ncbi:hypothetical protein KM043_007055 [Ampulex compressa]|nr:hypothetical protein KM043_007055 [Ampulex compressa]
MKSADGGVERRVESNDVAVAKIDRFPAINQDRAADPPGGGEGKEARFREVEEGLINEAQLRREGVVLTVDVSALENVQDIMKRSSSAELLRREERCWARGNEGGQSSRLQWPESKKGKTPSRGKDPEIAGRADVRGEEVTANGQREGAVRRAVIGGFERRGRLEKGRNWKGNCAKAVRIPSRIPWRTTELEAQFKPNLPHKQRGCSDAMNHAAYPLFPARSPESNEETLFSSMTLA